MNRVRLLVLNAALGPLDYRVPDGMDVKPGSVVLAPLGPRQISGIVWEADRLPATDPLHARIVPWLWNTGFTYPRRASYHDDDGSTWLEFEDRSQEIAAVRALWFDVRDACGLRDLVPTMPSE